MQVLGDFRRKVTMTIHCCNLHHNVWDHTISIPKFVVAAPPQPNSLDISDRQTDRHTHIFFAGRPNSEFHLTGSKVEKKKKGLGKSGFLFSYFLDS